MSDNVTLWIVAVAYVLVMVGGAALIVAMVQP